MSDVEFFGDRWTVVDCAGKTMCVGTMRQCEDWLDFRDNNPATGGLSFPARTANLWSIAPTILVWAATIFLGLYVLLFDQTTGGSAGSPASKDATRTGMI